MFYIKSYTLINYMHWLNSSFLVSGLKKTSAIVIHWLLVVADKHEVFSVHEYSHGHTRDSSWLFTLWRHFHHFFYSIKRAVYIWYIIKVSEAIYRNTFPRLKYNNGKKPMANLTEWKVKVFGSSLTWDSNVYCMMAL